jgi:SPRY domain
MTDTFWNPSDKSANITLSNGNLTATAVAAAWKSVRADQGKAAGKWYFEVVMDVVVDTNQMIGIGTLSANINNFVGFDVYGYAYASDGGVKVHNYTFPAFGDTWGLNDVIGVAYDLDAGKVWFSKNNVWQDSGDPAAGTNEAWSGLSGTFYPMFSPYANTCEGTAHFALADLVYSPPTGFHALDYAASTTVTLTESFSITCSLSGAPAEILISVTLTESFSATCNLSGTLKIGIPLTSSLSIQTTMSAEIGWRVYAEPFSVITSMSIGMINMIWRELLDRDSRITMVLEENSPITKTLERDSLISDLTENSILGT